MCRCLWFVWLALDTGPLLHVSQWEWQFSILSTIHFIKTEFCCFASNRLEETATTWPQRVCMSNVRNYFYWCMSNQSNSNQFKFKTLAISSWKLIHVKSMSVKSIYIQTLAISLYSSHHHVMKYWKSEKEQQIQLPSLFIVIQVPLGQSVVIDTCGCL